MLLTSFEPEKASATIQEQFNLAKSYINDESVGKAAEGVRIFALLAKNNYLPAINCLASCLLNGVGVGEDKDKALSLFIKAADGGNRDAQYNLGKCYEEGNGVEPDIKSAVYWYTKAAEQNDIDAQIDLAMYYSDDSSPDFDLDKAIFWSTKAAEQNDDFAQYCLGCIYNDESDYEKSFYWFSKSAAAGNESALQCLAYAYKNGQGVEADSQKSLEIYSQLASNGDAFSMRQIANHYYDDTDNASKAEAIKWYMKAADAGDYPAVRILANIYTIEGNNKEISANANTIQANETAAQNDKDAAQTCYKKAFEYFAKAAEMDECEANIYSELGMAYYDGRGVEQDHSKAYQFFKTGADAGDDVSMYHLAQCYHLGCGTECDDVQAAKWYIEAANAGNDDAAYWAGMVYTAGIGGVEANENQSFSWFKKSADAGSSDGAYQLALCYLDGSGTAIDYNEGQKWLKKAAEDSNAKACYKLGVFYSKYMVIPDLKQSEYWFARAKELGYDATSKPEPASNVSAQYDLNDPVQKYEYAKKLFLTDSAAALRLLEESARQGNYDAIELLFAKYRLGDHGVPQDFAKAAQWLEYGASIGSNSCKEHLAIGYLAGNYGFPKDIQKTYALCNEIITAEPDLHPHIEGIVGHLLTRSDEIERDNARGLQLIRKSAAAGDASAQFDLGCIYANGNLLPNDFGKAEHWFKLSADQGNKSAISALERVRKENLYATAESDVHADTKPVGTPREIPSAARTLEKDLSSGRRKAYISLALCLLSIFAVLLLRSALLGASLSIATIVVSIMAKNSLPKRKMRPLLIICRIFAICTLALSTLGLLFGAIV